MRPLGRCGDHLGCQRPAASAFVDSDELGDSEDLRRVQREAAHWSPPVMFARRIVILLPFPGSRERGGQPSTRGYGLPASAEVDVLELLTGIGRREKRST